VFVQPGVVFQTAGRWGISWSTLTRANVLYLKKKPTNIALYSQYSYLYITYQTVAVVTDQRVGI